MKSDDEELGVKSDDEELGVKTDVVFLLCLGDIGTLCGCQVFHSE